MSARSATDTYDPVTMLREDLAEAMYPIFFPYSVQDMATQRQQKERLLRAADRAIEDMDQSYREHLAASKA